MLQRTPLPGGETQPLYSMIKVFSHTLIRWTLQDGGATWNHLLLNTICSRDLLTPSRNIGGGRSNSDRIRPTRLRCCVNSLHTIDNVLYFQWVDTGVYPLVPRMSLNSGIHSWLRKPFLNSKKHRALNASRCNDLRMVEQTQGQLERVIAEGHRSCEQLFWADRTCVSSAKGKNGTVW